MRDRNEKRNNTSKSVGERASRESALNEIF
jgi:hypothetical protein